MTKYARETKKQRAQAAHPVSPLSFEDFLGISIARCMHSAGFAQEEIYRREREKTERRYVR